MTSSKDLISVFKALSNRALKMNNCRVNLSRVYDRKIVDSSTESRIDEQWKILKQKNSKLFNGSKFRFHSARCENNVVFLQLGITCYRDFVCTNLSQLAQHIYDCAKKTYNNVNVCFSDAFGVGGFIETSDKYTVLIKRSSSCAEEGDAWDRPGGHPEPEECSSYKGDLYGISSEDVLAELFNSTLREIRDEVNIDVKKMDEPLLMGIARNARNFGKPSAEFYVKCKNSSREIKQQYMKGTQSEAEESTQICFISIDDINCLENLDIWPHLTPAAKASFYFYVETIGFKQIK